MFVKVVLAFAIATCGLPECQAQFGRGYCPSVGGSWQVDLPFRYGHPSRGFFHDFRYHPQPLVVVPIAPPVVIQYIQPIQIVPMIDPMVAARPRPMVDVGEHFGAKRAPAVGAAEGVVRFDEVSEIKRRAKVLKTSTVKGREQADRLVSLADQSYSQQKLARAIVRYRDAIAKAPDYPEPHFRLAHAYIAAQQYNLALKGLLVALELTGHPQRDGFSLEDLYRGDLFVRQRHFATLVDASKREPEDGGLKFLIGYTLYFDGKKTEAMEYFAAAQELPGAQRAYAHLFLPIKAVAEVKPQP